jgi:hypothetical protein
MRHLKKNLDLPVIFLTLFDKSTRKVYHMSKAKKEEKSEEKETKKKKCK